MSGLAAVAPVAGWEHDFPPPEQFRIERVRARPEHRKPDCDQTGQHEEAPFSGTRQEESYQFDTEETQ